MKTYKSLFFILFTVMLFVSSAAQAQTHKKGWSDKAKGAAIGGGAGVVTGAVIGGGKGAVIGGVVGAVGGGLIGRNRDKKYHRARYDAYHNKKK